MILMVSLHLGEQVYVYYHPGIHTQHIFQCPSFDHFPTGDDPILYCKYSNIQLDGCTWVYINYVIAKISRIFILDFCFMFRPSFFCLYFSCNLLWRSCTRIRQLNLASNPACPWVQQWQKVTLQHDTKTTTLQLVYYILDISNRVLRGWDMLTLTHVFWNLSKLGKKSFLYNDKQCHLHRLKS